MRIVLIAIFVSTLLTPLASAQGRPDLSGTWALPADAPPGPNGKPAPAPGFGPTINIRQDANTITISRFIGGATVHVKHPLDGSESRSRAHGRLCEGDSQSIWTATWQGEGILTTMIGSQPPGAENPTKMDVKALFRLHSPDTLAVEMTYPVRGAQEPRRVTTLYRKSGPPSEIPPPPANPPFEARISQIDWLEGTWIGTTGTSTFEERWAPHAGGSMMAIARTLRGGVMFGFEFLCIVERNGGLVYQAMPNGRQPATDFTLTNIEGRSLTFENPGPRLPEEDPLQPRC